MIDVGPLQLNSLANSFSEFDYDLKGIAAFNIKAALTPEHIHMDFSLLAAIRTGKYSCIIIPDIYFLWFCYDDIKAIAAFNIKPALTPEHILMDFSLLAAIRAGKYSCTVIPDIYYLWF